MITGSQIRSARALIGWTRDEMAAHCGVSKLAIKNIEDGLAQPHVKTFNAITTAVNSAGVEFIERGVRWIDYMVQILEGGTPHLKLLDDVYQVLGKEGGEALFLCSSDAYAIPGEYEAEIRLREAGITFRSLVKAGIKKTVWPRSEYRQIPKEYFNHSLQVVYGEKVAQVLDEGRKVLIIHNPSLATTSRNMFNLIWSVSNIVP